MSKEYFIDDLWDCSDWGFYCQMKELWKGNLEKDQRLNVDKFDFEKWYEMKIY